MMHISGIFFGCFCFIWTEIVNIWSRTREPAKNTTSSYPGASYLTDFFPLIVIS